MVDTILLSILVLLVAFLCLMVYAIGEKISGEKKDR